MDLIKKLLKKLIPNFIFSLYHWKMAYLGAILYGFPSRKLTVIGVTGTKGKTTTCNLLAQILQGAGFKTGMATTVNFRIGDKEWINEYKQTMLGRFKLQKLLRQMVVEGCQYAVIETSSEGILQYRHKGINYSVAVFTNLSPEHIERHGSFEKYREAKMKLFEAVARKKDGIGVYNLDDNNAEYFLKIPVASQIGYYNNTPHPNPLLNRGEGENPPQPSFVKGGSVPLFEKGRLGGIYQISNIKLSPNKTEFDFNNKPFDMAQGKHFEMPLIGEFNVYNAAAAICVGLLQGIGMGEIKEILKHVKPTPGRLEVVNAGQPFTVIVDYAHEPASLEAVYKALKIFTPRKIIALLGAQGGGRDKAKRPILGKIAGEDADTEIVTNEDPYDEDPQEIIDDVAAGISSLCHSRESGNPESWIPAQGRNDKKEKPAVFKIIDRREAIKKALSLAQVGDIVIITGKGGEVWMCVENGKKIPWNERQIAEQELGKPD